MNMVCAYCGDLMVCYDNDEPVCCCGELHFVSEDEFVQMLATPPEPSDVDAAGTFVG